MNFKKSFSAVALAFIATASVGALASCGSKDPNKVVFWHTMGKSNQKLLNEMIESFHESDEGKYTDKDGNKVDIPIEHAAQGGYSDIKAKLLKAIPAKKTPVMAFAYPDHVAEYIKAGAALKLDDFINDPEIGLTADEKAGYSIYWAEGTCYDKEGSVYSVPFSKSTEVIFYNETVFEKNGYQLPQKWFNPDDPNDVTTMEGLCRKMKADFPAWYKSKNPTKTDAEVAEAAKAFVPLGYDSDDNLFITLSAQLGIPYTSLTPNGDGNFDFGGSGKGSKEARDMVTRIKKWYEDGLIVTKGVLPNNTYTSTKFVNQDLWMSIGSTGGTNYNKPKKGTFEANVAAIPQQDPENHPAVISQGPSICFFQNKKIELSAQRNAWKFYKWITEPENTAAYAMLTGYEPVRLEAYESDDYVAHKDLTKSDVTLFTKVAALTSTEAVTGSYFTSPAFAGSAVARDQVGGIITQVLLSPVKSDAGKDYEDLLDEKFDNAYTECIFASGV